MIFDLDTDLIFIRTRAFGRRHTFGWPLSALRETAISTEERGFRGAAVGAVQLWTQVLPVPAQNCTAAFRDVDRWLQDTLPTGQFRK